MRVSDPRVVAIVVTYNRQSLLRQALEALENASHLPDVILVIDNASSDGTPEYLQSRQFAAQSHILSLPDNVGGAGGFAVGMAHALAQYNPDLLWLLDDDTQVHHDTLEEALALWHSFTEDDRPAFIASRVLWKDGRDQPSATPRQRWGVPATLCAELAAQSCRSVRSAAFVSLLLNAEAVRRVGLPQAEYFLWNDDFELTTRLSAHRLGIASGKSRVTHHTKFFDADTAHVGDRFYFEVRNKLWMLTRSPGLRWYEKALYGGATALRWGKILARAKDPSLTLRAGLRGLRDGLVNAPRDTQVVLEQTHPLPEWKLASHSGEQAPFSVLIPVYRGDNAHHVRQALESVGPAQTRLPDQIVIVRDGPVPPSIEQVLLEVEGATSWAEAFGAIDIRIVRFDQRQGLAEALNRGLAACDHENVARMDADDIALPQRFARQIPYLEAGYDLVGSALEEMSADAKTTLGYRFLPTEEDVLHANTGFRAPFHHPTVVFRKSAVRDAGGYSNAKTEDYWLWMRMLRAGCRVTNVPEPLVRYRSERSYRRRGGWEGVRKEWDLQNRFLRSGYITSAQWARNVLVRSAYRMLPTTVRKAGYRGVFTRQNTL